MDRQDTVNRFQFNNHPAVHNQINPVAAIQSNALVFNRQCDLSLNPKSTLAQLKA